MRIIGGALGGRRFSPPANITARPTTDLAREALFNILNNLLDLEGCSALELFGGTGGVSYELASRGAAGITIVEQDAALVLFIKKTAAEFSIAPLLHIVSGDVFRFLKNATASYDLVFADPPYALPQMDSLPDLIFQNNLLKPDGIFVLEHSIRNGFTQHPHFIREKNYGQTAFSFFRKSNP